MRELDRSDLQFVGGGSGSSQGASQTCHTLASGATQCTSVNGNVTVIQTYDKSGNLTNSTHCTNNRSVSASAGNKVARLEGRVDGGSSCSSTSAPAPASGASQPRTGRGSKLLLIQMPDVTA